ncbi:MAG: M56 family metallopeptidase, partial [bacterium]
MVLLVRSLAALSRRRSQWRDEDIEIGPVLVSPDAGPAVVGLIRPRIVLPSWALSLDRSIRELLLRHELEHIRAMDTTTLIVAELVVIVFPWNAALWWMRRRLRSAIEIDCDGRVIRATGDAHAYGLALLAVGERHVASPSLPLANAWSERSIQLESRISAMTAPRSRRPIVASLPFVAVALGLVATTAWSPRPQPLSN